MVVAFIVGELAAFAGVEKGAALIVYLVTLFMAVAVCYGLFLLGRKVKLWDMAVLIGCCVCLLSGYLMFFSQAELFEKYDRLQYGESSKISVTGVVTSIIQKEYGYTIELKVDDGLVWVDITNIDGIRYGATLSVTGYINPMKCADNPGNYDEREYLHSNGVILKIKAEEDEQASFYESYMKIDGILENQDAIKNQFPDVVRILGDSDDYSFIKDSLYRIRLKAIEILSKQCDKKEMGLLSAIVLGEKSYIDDDIKELYSANAIAHVLSISGVHISVIGMGLYHLLRMRMRYVSSAAISATIMLLFVVMTGNSVSAVRAVIMFFLHVIADVFGRKNDMLSAISLSALVLLFDNPFYITNASFLLSYSAMIAVAVTAPVVTEYFKTENNFIKILLFNISLTITTIPVNMCLFYRLSTYSILLNLLVVPLMGLMLAMTILGMAVSMVSLVIGEACLGTSVYILRLYEWLCHMAEGLPEASVVTGSMRIEMVLLYYGLLVSVLLLMRRKDERTKGKVDAKIKCKIRGKWQGEIIKVKRPGEINEIIKVKRPSENNGKIKVIDLVIAALLIILIFIVYKSKTDGFEMIFLDVGQGDCAYIHSEDGNDYLIDCGSTDERNVGKYKLESFLEYKDVDCLEYVFISHCDTDHISGIIELIEREQVCIDNLVLSTIEKNSPSDNGRLLTELASKRGIDVLYFGKGSNIKDGQLEFICLNPESDTNYSDINEASMVLFMTYKSLVAFFAGDIGAKTELKLLEDISFYIDETKKKLIKEPTIIYKVSHHGSMYSNSVELLEVLKPDVSIISCGEDNSYGHPHEETLKRLESVGTLVLSTPESKAVVVDYDDEISIRNMGRSP